MYKVLVVEDDPFIVRLYTKTLEHEGFQVQVADNGLSALEQIPVFKPDIILLDIMMPTMNGMEFMQQTQNQAPIIVLTNMAEPSVANDAVNAGAKLVLVKSETEPDGVVSAINSILGQTNQPAAEAPAPQQ